jgi:hypothetical protein
MPLALLLSCCGKHTCPSRRIVASSLVSWPVNVCTVCGISGVAIGSQHSLLCIRVLSEAVNDLFVNAAQGTGSDFRAG